MRRIVLLLALFGCAPSTDAPPRGGDGGADVDPEPTGGATGGGGSKGEGDAGGGGGGERDGVDADGDGLDDVFEAQVAHDYFPFLSIHPDDGCPLHGVLYRLTPHPDDATKVMIWYDVLYQRDCGLNGHVGDNEVFSALVDPATAAPAGILALRAISHQDTPCQRVTNCGTLPGCDPCAEGPRGAAMFPVVFSSSGKHGGYVDEGSCDLNVICDFGGCTLAASADAPAMVNAGEPGAPLISDLSQQGFIVEAEGWTEAVLWAFDPWGDADFGDAGNVRDDLQDDRFVIAIDSCDP